MNRARPRKNECFIMFLQAMVLLVMGFGFVFAFLFAMIAAVAVSSRILRRSGGNSPEAAPKAKRPAGAKTAGISAASGDETVAVAAAAALARRYDPDALIGLPVEELIAVTAAVLRQRHAV
jgi:sodium pump decarboxylase gamma subunit